MATSKRVVRAAAVAACFMLGGRASADLPGGAATTAPATSARNPAPASTAGAPTAAEASVAPASTLMLRDATPGQLDALPDSAQVMTETGKKMTAAQAKKAKKAREKKLAKLKKKPKGKKGPKVVTTKPKKPAPTPAPAPTLARAATTSMALAPAASPALSAAPVGAVGGLARAGAANGMSGAADAYAGCGMSAQPQHYLSSVNGLSSGASFTPDGLYKIAGCGFGTKKGTVVLTGGSIGGMGNVSLLIESWANDAISARVDPKLAGIAEQTNVVLVVTPAGGGPMQQGGHSFAPAIEEVTLKSIPPGWVVSNNMVNANVVKSPADNGATVEVTNYYQSPEQFCPRAVTSDVLRLSQLVLKNGYWVDRAEVRALTPASVVQDGSDPDPSLFNVYQYGWDGDDFKVSPQWLQLYVPKNLFIGGYSFCQMGYQVTVYLQGPRGLPPQ